MLCVAFIACLTLIVTRFVHGYHLAVSRYKPQRKMANRSSNTARREYKSRSLHRRRKNKRKLLKPVHSKRRSECCSWRKRRRKPQRRRKKPIKLR